MLASASHQPASTSQMMLPMVPSGPVPMSSRPEIWVLGTATCPNGRKVKSAMFMAARAHGMPMMVMAMITAASTQAKAIHRPPVTIHRTFSTTDNK